jgi:hypothetical protein
VLGCGGKGTLSFLRNSTTHSHAYENYAVYEKHGKNGFPLQISPLLHLDKRIGQKFPVVVKLFVF